MYTRLWALALAFVLFSMSAASGLAAELGPASTYDELREYIAAAKNGDVIVVSGELSVDTSIPLSSGSNVKITSSKGESAVIRGLRLHDASLTLSNIHLEDSLIVDGTSHIQLASNVSISGSAGQSGLAFSGSGTLIIDRGCEIIGGSESVGVSISHHDGEFYASIEGTIQGGSGQTGGAGVVITPLSASGAVMISGTIKGGDGSLHGGHALNLYDLSGNAFVTVDGNLQGGKGIIGGDGIQLVAARDSVSVGIGGRVKGGRGETYGGDALILMNAEGASSFHLSGTFSGGDAAGVSAQPGTSLQLVGDSASSRARVEDCILEDGKKLSANQQPAAAPDSQNVTPLPEITSSADNAEPPPTPTQIPTSEPKPTPAPSEIPSEATPGEAS